MRRRDFIKLIAGSASGWPLTGRAQQAERLRRIGVFLPGMEGNKEARYRFEVFRDGLKQLGWAEGRSAHFDVRSTGGKREVTEAAVVEILASTPDVILANGTTVLSTLLQHTRTMPIVFVQVSDPVAGGYVRSLSKPGGNVTGFINFEYAIAGKWVTLLREIAPRAIHLVAVLDPLLGTAAGVLGAVQAVSSALGLELRVVTARDGAEIEHEINVLARDQDIGLIFLPGPAVATNYERIIAIATEHRMPAIFPYRYLVAAGGLASYGPDPTEEYRKAASYVDRILRGEKPADLPVQSPTKYELAINLKTAKAIGLTIPPTLVARADEVIE
jgi:putative tryptophan/tyrosine transport system substrate-binding protein